LLKNFILIQWAYLSARWWLTVAAADLLDLPRRLDTCAGERLVANVMLVANVLIVLNSL
jgi:hypothetical protein